MYTLNGVWAIVAGSATIAVDEINKLYWKLVKIAAILCGLVFIQWLINSSGAPGLNFFFFFAVGGLILVMGFSPLRGPGTGAVIGTVFAALKDADLSQGALAGILGWMRGVMILLFGYWVISGVLATWPFRENPLAFWPIAAMGCILAAMAVVYGLKGKMLPKIVTIYAVGVMAISAYTTVPFLKGWFQGPTETSTQQAAPAATPPATRRQEVVCDHQERLLVDSRSWKQALETPGCEFHISRGRGPILEMRINKDNATIRDFPETGAPKYNSPAWVMEFRLKGPTTQPVAITVQHVRP